MWRGDGKEIFYIDDGYDLIYIAAPFNEQSGPGLPHKLFHVRTDVVFAGRTVRAYDAAPDGKRFLIPEPDEEAAAVPITVLINWPVLVKPRLR